MESKRYALEQIQVSEQIIQRSFKDGDLMTIPEVAAYLGVKVNTARNHIRTGGLPVLRVSNKTVRVKYEALREWLDQKASN